jgi:hypothetical protein
MRRYILSLTLLCATVQAATVYDFDSIADGTSTSFVHPGTPSATFTSPSGPVFVIGGSFFSGASGNVLFDADAPLNVLDIGFSSPVNFISMFFALNGAVSDKFTLEAYSGGVGGTLVGSVQSSGIVPGGIFTFPEGTIAFGGPQFDTVRLSATSQDFAIDNVAVDGEVPEPSTLSLFLTCPALFWLARKRRRGAQQPRD